MKFVIDMNLSPRWCQVLAKYGWTAVHWSDVGDPRALDPEVLSWAEQHGHILLTHDLDFGVVESPASSRFERTTSCLRISNRSSCRLSKDTRKNWRPGV